METTEIKYIVLSNVYTGIYTAFREEEHANKFADATLIAYPLMPRPPVFKVELLPPP